MKRFKVTARVEFVVEDTNEFNARRQATASILKYILNDPNHADYNAEYPTLPLPHFVAGEVEIRDEDGKVLLKFLSDDENPQE